MGPCCVEGCEVTSEETYYFEFPTSRTLRRKWLDVIPIPGKLPIGTVVCSRHFNADDYENVRGKVRLKRKVVPSLLLEEINTTKQNNTSSPKSPKSPMPPTSPIPPSSPNIPKSPESPPKEPVNCDSTTVSVPSPIDAEKLIDEIQNERRCGDIGDKQVITEAKDVCKVVNKENGWSGVSDKVVVKSPEPSLPDPKEDIEDMITNYQIKNKVPNPALLADLVPPPSDKVLNSVTVQQSEIVEPIEIEIEDVKEAEPVFIEISVDKDTNATGAAGSQDCLMLLESVQVEVDPSTLMLDHEDYYEEKNKKSDPISLLTSSDEDDVIIQEPHIDTVEVSDETDEDDMPLVKLVKKKSKKKKLEKKKSKRNKSELKEHIGKIVWGMYDFYCMQCNFSTKNCVEYNKHVEEHSTIIQVCPICGFTSASKTMFSKHKRIHKVEKKFKCHICDFRARHKMSLIYHLKSHNSESSVSDKIKCKSDLQCENDLKCSKCGFTSDIKGKTLQHISLCLGSKRHLCDKCDYATKKKSDLTRHKMRRHKYLDDNDGDDNDGDDNNGDDDYAPEA